MAKQTISYLKGRFQTGAKPSQQDYSDAFDSYVHKDDLEAINNADIDARINVYDTSLREESGTSSLSTLGDLLKVFEGYDSSQNLQELLESLGGVSVGWNSITSRPDVAVVWEEQAISLDTYYAANIPATPASFEGIGSQIKSVVNVIGLVPSDKRTVIKDIRVVQFPVAWHNTSYIYYATHISSVVIGISPKVQLSTATV